MNTMLSQYIPFATPQVHPSTSRLAPTLDRRAAVDRRELLRFTVAPSAAVQDLGVPAAAVVDLCRRVGHAKSGTQEWRNHVEAGPHSDVYYLIVETCGPVARPCSSR